MNCAWLVNLDEKQFTIQIFAISGTLRLTSSNTELLHAAAILAPESVTIKVHNTLGNIPLFNPDIEDNKLSSVIDFRTCLTTSDGVLISSPEYAHGVPGALKNTLDWVVGGGELMNKPVALLNASILATHAQAHLYWRLSL